jgi:hypothetical protein
MMQQYCYFYDILSKDNSSKRKCLQYYTNKPSCKLYKTTSSASRNLDRGNLPKLQKGLPQVLFCDNRIQVTNKDMQYEKIVREIHKKQSAKN